MAREYHIVWKIELDADSYEEAALAALATMRDSASIATVFSVTDRKTSICKDIDTEDLEDG